MGRGFINDPLPYGTPSWSFGARLPRCGSTPIPGRYGAARHGRPRSGRAINPLAAEGQIDGQVFSAMSQVLYERD